MTATWKDEYLKGIDDVKDSNLPNIHSLISGFFSYVNYAEIVAEEKKHWEEMANITSNEFDFLFYTKLKIIANEAISLEVKGTTPEDLFKYMISLLKDGRAHPPRLNDEQKALVEKLSTVYANSAVFGFLITHMAEKRPGLTEADARKIIKRTISDDIAKTFFEYKGFDKDTLENIFTLNPDKPKRKIDLSGVPRGFINFFDKEEWAAITILAEKMFNDDETYQAFLNTEKENRIHEGFPQKDTGWGRGEYDENKAVSGRIFQHASEVYRDNKLR